MMKKNWPLEEQHAAPRGAFPAGGFRSIVSIPRRAWSDRIPYPASYGTTRCSGYLRSYSRDQRLHDRHVGVEPPTHSASAASRVGFAFNA